MNELKKLQVFARNDLFWNSLKMATKENVYQNFKSLFFEM